MAFSGIMMGLPTIAIADAIEQAIPSIYTVFAPDDFSGVLLNGYLSSTVRRVNEYADFIRLICPSAASSSAANQRAEIPHPPIRHKCGSPPCYWLQP